MSFFARTKTALETLSTVLVIAAASGLIWALFFKSPQSSSAAQEASLRDASGTIAATHLSNSIGAGRLAIVEFSDFQCPFCAQHAEKVLPAIKKDIVDAGVARYSVVNLPLSIHSHAVPAAEAAECAADEGKYWDMHALLFQRQAELATADFTAYGQELGFDDERFSACLNGDSKLSKIQADKALADRMGIRGTPTFFLGRVRNDGGIDLLKRIGGLADVQTWVREIDNLKGQG